MTRQLPSPVSMVEDTRVNAPYVRLAADGAPPTSPPADRESTEATTATADADTATQDASAKDAPDHRPAEPVVDPDGHIDDIRDDSGSDAPALPVEPNQSGDKTGGGAKL